MIADRELVPESKGLLSFPLVSRLKVDLEEVAREVLLTSSQPGEARRTARLGNP